MTNSPPPIAAVIRVLAATFFVGMSTLFVALPYAMSAHPGDAARQVPAAEARHLS